MILWRIQYTFLLFSASFRKTYCLHKTNLCVHYNLAVCADSLREISLTMCWVFSSRNVESSQRTDSPEIIILFLLCFIDNIKNWNHTYLFSQVPQNKVNIYFYSQYWVQFRFAHVQPHSNNMRRITLVLMRCAPALILVSVKYFV